MGDDNPINDDSMESDDSSDDKLSLSVSSIVFVPHYYWILEHGGGGLGSCGHIYKTLCTCICMLFTRIFYYTCSAFQIINIIPPPNLEGYSTIWGESQYTGKWVGILFYHRLPMLGVIKHINCSLAIGERGRGDLWTLGLWCRPWWYFEIHWWAWAI